MKRLLGVLVVGVLCVQVAPLNAQHRDSSPVGSAGDLEREAIKWLPERRDTLQVVGGGPFLIRPFLQEEGIRFWINGQPVANERVSVDLRHGLIFLDGIAPDSAIALVAAYRHIPLPLDSAYRLWSARDQSGQAETSEVDRGTNPPSGGLSTKGRVTRGLLTGSNRNARIESGLQLEIEGEVAPGVTLQAELTDEDTPLVPEGVTRQFDQFDRIRIGFRSRHGQVDLGDYDAVLEDTRYGVLRRKLQGASFSTEPLSTGGSVLSSIRTSAGAAISRGQFHSVDLDILEGVQGPYRLTGAAGERFILVLPATERVYLDGVLLKRGTDQDYTMDYALGELTFTTRHVMGAERRVRIDYEYTTNRFTRTMSFAQTQLGFGAKRGDAWARLTFGGIREADGEAFIDESGLSSSDSALVAGSVDGNVLLDGATQVVYDPEALYTQYLRQGGDGGDVIYVELRRNPLPDEPVFRVPFSFAGAGEGEYIRIPSQGGGIAYEWVGPGNGAYIAARTLPVPSRKMLGEVRLDILGIPGVRLETGMAGSSLDRNRLSPSSASELNGSIRDIRLDTRALPLARGWHAQASGSWYVRTASFETFERVRPVEFIRDWGLPQMEDNPFGSLIPGQNERLRSASASFVRSDSSSLTLNLGLLHLGRDVRAARQSVDTDLLLLDRIRLRSTALRTDTDGTMGSAFQTLRRYAKVRFESARLSHRWQPWVEGEWDHWREEGEPLSGAFGSSSKSRVPFRAGRAGIIRLWSAHTVGFSGSLREEEDRVLDEASTLSGSRIHVVQGSWDWRPSTRIQSASSIGWRRSRPVSAGAGTTGEAALLLGWQGQIRSASAGTVRWNYAVRSEQTASLQEVYIRTGPQRGHYVWMDISGDGRIQLDEFFPETTPGEGEYARTLFPSDSLEAVTTAEARFSHVWLPSAASTAWKRVSLNTTIDVRETSRTEDRAGVYLLQPSSLRQPGSTVDGRIRMMQRAGFYPLRRDRDVNLSVLRTASLSELASGGETTAQTRFGIEIRDEVSRGMDLMLESMVSSESSESERFSTRSFDIARWEVRPGGVARFGNWRLQAEWMVGRGNEEGTGARVATHRIPVDMFWNRGSTQWRWGAEWSESRIRGGAPLGLQLFELTEGRGAGTSWMWHVHLDMQLTEIMSATLRYDGRRPTGTPVIHTGRFQLSARF